MSHSRIRVKKSPAQRNPRLEGIFVGVAGVLALAIAILTLWDRPHEPHVTAEGKILDTRIVVDSIRESMYGGRASYRLEARVSYDLAGVPQDRWLVADTIGNTHEAIVAQLGNSRRSCVVYWREEHPESARCRLE